MSGKRAEAARTRSRVIVQRVTRIAMPSAPTTMPIGGIRAVFSLAPGTPLKRTRFAQQDAAFAGAKRYADWIFAQEVRG